MFKLTDTAEVIRSKNSGPYELTFDIIFKDVSHFNTFVAVDAMTPTVFADLYGIDVVNVRSVLSFPPAKAVKITVTRPMSSGALGERDIYGAQQHGPLLNFEYEV